MPIILMPSMERPTDKLGPNIKENTKMRVVASHRLRSYG